MVPCNNLLHDVNNPPLVFDNMKNVAFNMKYYALLYVTAMVLHLHLNKYNPEQVSLTVWFCILSNVCTEVLQFTKKVKMLMTTYVYN